MVNKQNLKGPIRLGDHLILITLMFLVILFITLFIKSLTQSLWPYVIMAGISVLMGLLDKIQAPRKTMALVFITTIMILFGIQFWFYFVIPDYYDYQPITNPRLMMVYQLQGKIQIFYSPDYPKQGDTISGYISNCSNDYSQCFDIASYRLTAFFIDKSGTQHTLIDSKEFNNKTNFEISYMDDPIYVIMEYNDEIYSFILPKRSFWQTFWIQFNRHPVWGLISIIGTILGIITIFNLSKIKNLFGKIKATYINELKKIHSKSKKKK